MHIPSPPPFIFIFIALFNSNAFKFAHKRKLVYSAKIKQECSFSSSQNQIWLVCSCREDGRSIHNLFLTLYPGQHFQRELLFYCLHQKPLYFGKMLHLCSDVLPSNLPRNPGSISLSLGKSLYWVHTEKISWLCFLCKIRTFLLP